MSRASEYAQDVSRILQAKGEAVAQGHLRRGAVWGQTLATLGERVPQHVQQVMKQNAEKRRTEQLQGIFQKHGQDLPAAISEVMQIDPELGMDLGKRYGDAAKTAYELKKLQSDFEMERIDRLMNLIASATDADSYTQALVTAKLAGLPMQGIKTEYDPLYVAQAGRELLSQKERLEADKPKAPTFSWQDTVRDGKAGKIYAENVPGAFVETPPSAPTPYQQEQLDIRRGQLAVSQGNLAARTNEAASGGAARTAKENPEFPEGVRAYLMNLRQRGYTRQQAESEVFGKAWPKLKTTHPRLSHAAVKRGFDDVWPLDAATGEPYPVTPPSPSPAPSPGGRGSVSTSPRQQRTATAADVKAVAQRLQITEAEARRQLEARGVVVR